MQRENNLQHILCSPLLGKKIIKWLRHNARVNVLSMADALDGVREYGRTQAPPCGT